MPYSNGLGYNYKKPNENVYPDEFFINKIIDSVNLLKEQGIPDNLCYLSLKDMTGELSAETAPRLIPKIIKALRGSRCLITFGLHLHNTGIAPAAYAAAIKACKNENWPISVDIVEGKGTGFVSAIELNEELKKIDINLLNDKQISEFKKMEKLSDKVAEDYKLIKVTEDLSGEELRKFRIPGGAYTSFSKAIKEAGFSQTLGISEEDSMLLAGNALNAVGVVMGVPFGVTPGFQNKQIAAINYLHNLINKKVIGKGMSCQYMIDEVLTSLNKNSTEKKAIEQESKNIKEFFLHNLNDNVKEFLKGTMPSPVHPTVLENINVSTSEKESHLEKYKELVKRLQKEGKIKPTSLQVKGIMMELCDNKILEEDNIDYIIDQFKTNKLLHNGRPNGKKDNGYIRRLDEGILQLIKDNKIKKGKDKEVRDLILERTSHNAIAWAIVLAEDFEKYITSPWYFEPDIRYYDSETEYHRGCKKFQQGLNPSSNADRIEQLRQIYQKGGQGGQGGPDSIKQELDIEKLKIKKFVTHFVEKNLDLMSTAAKDTNFVAQLTRQFYESQQNYISDNLSITGVPPFYLEDENESIYLNYLKNELVTFVEENKKTNYNFINEIGTIIDDTVDLIKSIEVKATQMGRIEKLFNYEVGQEVKAGYVFGSSYCAKMNSNLKMKHDGRIEEIYCKVGDNVKKGQILMKLQKPEQAEDLEVKSLEEEIKNQYVNKYSKQINQISELKIEKTTNKSYPIYDLETNSDRGDQDLS